MKIRNECLQFTLHIQLMIWFLICGIIYAIIFY